MLRRNATVVLVAALAVQQVELEQPMRVLLVVLVRVEVLAVAVVLVQ
jgi:hypothetical protein